MGGLSSGPGPGLCLLTLVVLIVAQQVQSAPVQEENLSPQSRAQGYYDGSSSELSTGCYYNFQHYGEGDRIITNEPCLNCTCHNRMLMCYLRVCPFTKAIGQNCTIEKKPGQCCPLIICPEVPVQLLTSSTTTEHSESYPHKNQIGYGQYGTAVGHLDDYGCKINGEFYTNGAQIPGNIDKPCEVCYCIRNRTACIMQECTLQVEGCIPVYEEGLCCPVRYQCDYEYNYNAITTEQPRPTPGLVLTTTTSGPFECQHDNKWYADGAMVDTEDSCEHCYCMKGDIVCAVQECKPPFEKDGHNCTAMPPAPGKCCPDSYHCDGNEIVDESEPTFRQDRMHKFGQNNANITMSITSSTSSGDKQHGWHYGTSSNENEMPNRFTDEHDKDGTKKPGKPASDSDMMVTEGVPPTTGPLESGSHHIEGHGGGSGTRPQETHTGMRPMEGQSSTGQGHGVNTDNMLTISQVIQSIVQNQTNLFNQNKVNQTGRPEKPSQHDDKIVFPTDLNLQKRPGIDFQTDEDGNPIEAHSGTTEFPNEYYGLTGSIPNIYAQQSGRPQEKPITHKKPGTAGNQGPTGQPVSGENQDFGGHKRPGMTHATGEHGMTEHPQKKPIIHQQPGMAGTLVVTDDEGNPIEIYEGATGKPEMASGQPGSSGVYSTHGEKERPKPGMHEGFTGRPDSDGIYSSLGEYGQSQKGPTIHKKPADVGGDVMGSHDLSGKPGITDQPEIFGEHGHTGRPHKKPITHKKPGVADEEMVTEMYEEITGSSLFTGEPVTDEHGHPLSRPGSEVMTDKDGVFHGKPQKIPSIHKQPGDGMSEDDVTEGYQTVTETVQDLIDSHESENGFTGRPSIHKKPGSSESPALTGEHGKPATHSDGHDGEYIYYDKYGKPHKRPVVHKRPGAGGDEEDTYFTGTTKLPDSLSQGHPDQDELTTPSKKPQIHITPGMTAESDFTDEDGNPIEEIAGFPGADEFETYYDKYGRPYKRPATHKTPTGEVMTDEHGTPVEGMEQVTENPEGSVEKPGSEGYQIFYDQQGRPHKRPITGIMTDKDKKPVAGEEGFTEEPEQDGYQIFYDQHGRPHKRPVIHKKPVSGVMTDEDGKPIDGVEGVTEYPEGFTGKPEDGYQIFYDQHGRPHKRPVTHKKPVSGVFTDEHGKPVDGVESVTDFPEGFTGKPEQDGYQIFYDQHGRPHKRPVTHKKPVSGVLTDKHGEPIEGVEGATEYPEGFTGKPGTEDEQIFYDQYGRPHKRPVTHKKPVSGVLTDEHGKPVDGMEDVTEYPEGFTGKPEQDGYQIFYDEHGRPHKRPVTGVLTDELGKPVDGAEGVTEFPEGFTGKPGLDGYQIFYDKHGRPHKRPITHKRPGDGVLTDEHGTPVDGMEGVTDYPEGFTGKPGIEDGHIFYDEQGRPHKRPVTHKKPVIGGVTEGHDKPIDGMEYVTEYPEGFTGTPEQDGYQIFYDQHGRPHKRPVTHKKPVSGIMTDEDGKPIDGVEGVTDFPEGFTGKPEDDGYQIFYDQHGRPHKRPITHKKPVSGVGTDEHGKPLGADESVTDFPEGFTGKPEQDGYQIFYDQHGRPHKRPVTQKKPVSGVLTDEHGEPIEGVEAVTEYPEGFTGKPGTEDGHIFYDEHGRPHKRPITHEKPGDGILTDEHGKPVDGMEDVTEYPEGFTGKPEQDGYQIFYDEHGRPHKRPVTHKKPASEVLTDEHGKPGVDGMESVTEHPEGFTGKPEDGYQIFYDQHGRPHKRPVIHKKPVSGVLTDEHGKPVDGVEGVTDFPDGFTGKPGSEDEQIFYDEHGRPHKRPVTHKKPVSGVVTDEHGKPIDGVEDVKEHPEGFTGKPDQDGYQVFYDQHGRPHKRPVTHKKPVSGVLTDENGEPVEGVEGVTEYPEGFTGKPGTEDEQIIYDEHGRPHKRPVTHKKPVSGVLTDEHGKPVDGMEGVTEYPEGFTGKPGTEDEQIFYDEHGRPHKRPDTHKKPVSGVMTDEHGKPIEGVEAVTEYPEGFTGKPEQDGLQIFYDEQGRPHKRPITHKKPGTDGEMLPESHETPIDAVTKSPGHVEGPDHDGITEIMTGYGHTGKPDAKPSQFIPESEAVEVVTDGTGISADVDEATTMTSAKKPGIPTAADGTTNLGELDVTEEPHKRPHKPGIAVDGTATDEENVEPYPGVPDSEIHPVHDVDKIVTTKPVTHSRPEENVMTDEKDQTVEVTTHVTKEQTDLHHGPGSQQVLFDEDGKPHKKPVVHKKPGENATTDEYVKPGEDINVITEIPAGVSDKPESDSQLLFYDQFGRPHKRPATHEKPGEGAMTDEHGKPGDGVESVTDFPDGFTGKPGTEDEHIFYDEQGRPHKRPDTHKKPVSGVMTDEHGKPIEGVEAITEHPEGFTGKPEEDGYQIFYDQHGRPHKRPVTHKKPVTDGVAEEHGKPIDGMEDVTEYPEGFTGKPEQDGYQIFYDQHGRPHKRPVIHKTPVSGVQTDEHGKPVDGMEDVTEYPEGSTGKPGAEDEQIFYDQYGRPHKRPVTHKKPGDGVMTDEEGEAVDKFTETPDSGTHEIPLDPYGRPVKKPVTHTKPEGTETDVDHEETTESFEAATTGPESVSEGVMYDNLGRPQKKPGTDNVYEHVLPQGKPEQGQTQDGADHSQLDRPHSRPPVDKEPSTDFGESLPEEGESSTKVPTEGVESEPGVEQGFFGETGRPQKKPVSSVEHKHPSSTDTTEDPAQTDSISTETGEQIFYDEHGRPHKKPVTDTRPSLTDEKESPLTGATEAPDGQTAKPGSDEMEIVYDKYGKPHKRPISHVKPDLEGTQILTDDIDQHPIEKDTTETPEEQATILEKDKTDLSDQKEKKPTVEKEKPDSDTTVAGHGQDGLPQKQPDSYPQPAVGDVTEKEPDREEVPQIFGEHGHTGRPQKIPDVPKKPGTSMEKPMPEENDSLVGLTTELPETDETDIIFDKYGRPHKRPTTYKKPEVITPNEHAKPDGPEGITDVPEDISGKPGTDEQQIYYDPQGRPHKKPVTHEKPGETMTDEHDLPHEGMEVITESVQTNKPEDDSQQVSYDEYGRPYKRPVVQKKPGDVGMIGEAGKPLEGDAPTKFPGDNEVTDIPEGFTGKPGTEDGHIFYDEHGRPHKRPVIHKKPVSGVLTDENGEPIEGVEGVTEYPEGFTGKPGTEDEQIIYDEHGRPHKRPVTHKKPVSGVVTDEHGKPVDGMEGVTGYPEGFTGKPGTEDEQIFYDEQGRPHKRPVIHKKPVSGVLTDEHGKPVDGMEGATEYPEGFTGKPGTEDEQIFYDEHGRPHKRPDTHKKPVSGVMTDEHGKPIEGVEAVTEYPEGFTGKPEQDGLQIFYDEQGRPHKRPVTHKEPGSDGEMLPESHETPVDSVTKSPEGHVEGPEHDGITEIMIGYGYTGKPDQFIPGPEGISPTEKVGSMTKSPESSTGHSAQTEKPDDLGETHEHGKPHGGEMEPLEGQTKKPGHEDTSEAHGEPDHHGRPQEKPQSQTKPSEHEQPEQDDDKHPVHDYQKPSDHLQPGVTEDSGTAAVEDLTETPESGNEDQLMIFGEHGHTGRPHKRPVKPTVPGTSESDISGTPEEKPEAPVISQTQDAPVSGTPVDKLPDVDEDHVTTDKKKPELESDEMATMTPDKATTSDEDQVLHKKPDTEESQLTGDKMETSDKGITLAPDQHEHKKPIPHPDEGVVPAEEGPESQSPDESVTEKLGDDGTEVYYDNLGQPQKRPVHSRPSGTDQMPETGPTDHPIISGEHGLDDDQHKPTIDGTHSTEGTFHEKPDEMAKPGSADGDEKKPEFDEGEPIHDSHPEKPHKKPVLKPGLDASGVMVDETGEPETGTGLTEIPEAGEPQVHHEETGSKPSKKPTMQEVDEGIESTTKLPSGAAHDTKTPGIYDGQTPVDHKPEENEIFGVPEKDDTGVDDDSVTKLPGVAVDTFSKLPTSQKKPTATGHEGEDGHPGSSGTGITPEVDQANDDDDTATEEDDESLVITTDESEEDETEVHPQPESDAEGKPFVPTPKIPSHIVPGQQGSTPGLGSESDDFTTPASAAHDASGAPITEKDGTAHVTSGKPDEHVPGMSTGFDEESRPDDVTTPKGISETLSSAVSEDHAKPAGADKTSAPTGSTPVPEDDGDESHVPEKDLNKGGISETAIGHGDSHPDLSPTQDTDGVTSPDAGAVLDVVTPVSTPEGTHGVPESTGSVPSGEMHPVISSTTETPGKVSETKPAPHQPPQISIPYLPPDDNSSTKHPILIDEALHESSAPFDDIINNLANILRPSQATEEPEGTTEDHGDIPGEGSCFMDGVTYQHNEDIPPLSPCHTKCTCISSIIHCLSLKCPPPPEDVSHCTVVHEENSCCPIYVCGTDVSPTFPVENHEGETTTDSSADKDESATVHGYEPGKPTKPGVTSQKPEVTESEDSSHVDHETPIKHETDDKTSQESKPGVVGESKKPQFGSEVPEESDKGTPLTERPEEESVDETHTSQGMDHVMSSKPGSTVTEASTDGKMPTKTTEGDVTPDKAHTRPGETQSGYHPIPFDSKHPSTILPIYFGTEKPELPYQSHHKPESVDHVLGTDKPGQEGTEPSSAAESVKPQEDKQKPAEMDGSKPDDFSESATHRPVHHGTTKPVEGLSQEDKTPEKDTAEKVEPMKPAEAEKESEPSKPHEHDETETDVHSTLEEQESDKPVEKPGETTSSKGKPQSGQEPSATEEPEHQATERPGDKVPQFHAGTSEDEEIVHGTSKPHEKPEIDGKPSYSDVTPAHTTVKPHEESPVTEESYNKHQSTDEQENDFVQSSSQKPGLQESTTPDLSAESEPSVKPVTHDKPSEEEAHKQKPTLDTEKPMEASETQKPGQPTSEVSGTETMPSEADVVSADKTHPGASGPTYDTVNEDEEPSKKPEESTDELNQTPAYSTTTPGDHSESGKPFVPSGDVTDTHKKPQPGHDGEEETLVTSEGPHKEFSTESYPSPVSEDSENITAGPHEETPEEPEDSDDKHPSVHPASMDNESALTTEEPSAEDKKPHGKPETEVHPSLTDEKSSTIKPGEEPSEVEHAQTKPESGDELVVRPTEEGAVVKKPAVSEKPVFGEKVPQGEEETDLIHLTTESQMTDEKSGEAKPQHPQDFSSTARPKPTGVHGVSGQGELQTDDIPEEVLLHPTRTPGTYETERPDLTPEVEEDALSSQKPHVEDENLATIFPQGIIRPITKRPIYGTGKPVVSDSKESTTPGYPFIQLGPQTSQVPGKPEDTFEVTARPIFDIMTDVPEDFAQIFGIKPSTVHGQQPDKYDKPEHTTHISVPDLITGVSTFKPQTVDHVKRPIHTTNGTHFIQYVPYKEGEMPLVPEGATLGELIEKPDGQKYWPIIYMKLVTTTPAAEISQLPFKPVPQQVFNETHFIQYVPYEKDKEPEVPEGAALGQPQRGPDDQMYWPIIGKKPIMVPVEKPVTEPPYPGQVFNGTHFIQYVPFREGQKPEVPEEATLGEPENAPNGQKYWPIISTMPIPEDETVTSQSPLQSQPEQIFNGTHFIQFAPYNDGQEPEIPEDATLGQPQKGPDGQVYWPIIDTKPLPVIPDKLEPITEQPFPSVQVFNGTNFIQYVPFKDGVTPEVPEGATLGQPQKGPDGQMYWPIIYMRPRPVKPQGSFPEQVYNGTNFIQYVPYKEGHKPEVPSHATLGQPQQAPDGQMYWPIIYMKPVTAKPEDEKTTERPPQAPVFNGTHFIQYVPYMEGFEPDTPEEAILGKPEKRPDGQTYWPIIYHKLPTRPKPETVQHYPGQFFNGTHFVQYLPYRPSHKPHVPEGVILSQPQKGPDGQMYWMIVSTKPLPAIQEKPTGPQFFNGTHFIQYVPYEKEKEPEVPEGATLGKPEVGTGGQKFWPIIYMKPLPGIPITHQKPLDQVQGTPFDPYNGQVFNGTHYVQYVPYEPGKTPLVPEGVTLGQPTKRPNGQLYWPIYYLKPIQGTPVQGPMFWSPYDQDKLQPEQVFNGTHFIQYLPYNPTRMPEVPEGATLGQPQKGPEGQMYWVIISDKPLPAQAFNDSHVVQYVTPVTPEQAKPQTDQHKPIQVFNGTHYIQYVPYTPGQKPVLPEGASLGQPTQGPEGQMYWPIIYMKPQPGKPTQQVPIFWGPSHDHMEPVSGQIFNGTHYIRYVKYDPSMKPIAPEGASISEPQRRPDGQLYWVIVSKKPLFDMQVPVQQHPGQIFNGTHYIQYVPYNASQMPQVPEGAILGHPQKGPEGQMYWVIISDKPLPAQPGTQYVQYVTPVTPEDEQMVPGPMFNGTHFIQYVPYKTGHIPKVPQDAILGELHKGPGGQMYWPIIYRKPPQSYNGTHYVQHVPDADSGKPTTGTHHIQPVNATSKPAEDHPFWSYGQYAPRPGNGTLPTVNKYPGQKPGTEEHAFWTYGHDKPQNASEDGYPYKPTTEYPSWSSGQAHNATKVPEISKLPSGQYGGSDHSKPGYEYESGYYKPEKPERPSAPEDSYEGMDEDHLIEYPSGSDYDETQEQPYGPGTCRYAGKVYVSAQQIPRDDPCDFCFCFRSDIICLQQSCPPPIPGCHEEPIQGFCCPRYECHVRMATLLNVTSTTTTTTTTLPPHFLSHVYKGAAGRTGCFIQGKAYRVGQAIPSASGPCMDCMCGGDGKMKCEPKVCTPEPMVRQMMVSSEKPTTANHR